MGETLCIKNGTYCAHLALDGLPTLKLVQIRRLFRCMLGASGENEEAIALLRDLLPTLAQTPGAQQPRWQKIETILNQMKKEK